MIVGCHNFIKVTKEMIMTVPTHRMETNISLLRNLQIYFRCIEEGSKAHKIYRKVNKKLRGITSTFQLSPSSVPVVLSLAQFSRTEICFNPGYYTHIHPYKLYLSHFLTTQEAEIWYGSLIKPNYVNQLTSQPPASLPEILWQAMIFLFWSYIHHFKSNFDGVKSKVGLLNWYNLSSYLASLPEIPWLVQM